MQRTKKAVFRFVRKLPYIKQKIAEEMAKSRSEMAETFHDGAKGLDYIQTLPKKGLTQVLF